jgi:predicted dienelactone hydrolase
LSDIHVPVQLWEAEHDAIVEDSPATIRRLMPADLPVNHRVVPGAGHFSFLVPCSTGMRIVISVMGLFSGTEAICDDPGGFDRSAFHRRFNRDLIDFFDRTLPIQSS